MMSTTAANRQHPTTKRITITKPPQSSRQRRSPLLIRSISPQTVLNNNNNSASSAPLWRIFLVTFTVVYILGFAMTFHFIHHGQYDDPNTLNHSTMMWPSSSRAMTASMQSNTTSTTSVTNLNGENNEFMSACLCVNDDNHYFIEWIAYHYFVCKLRHLVIAVDPYSQTQIQPIVQRWQNYMTIEVWNIDEYYDTKRYPVTHEEQNFYRRQEQFNWKCLAHLKQREATWAFVIDVDEYMLVNPQVTDPSHEPLYRDPTDDDLALQVPSIDQPNSVLTVVQQLLMPDPQYHFVTPCLLMARAQFSPRLPEQPYKDRAAQTQEELFPTSGSMDKKSLSSSAFFQTLTWDRHGQVQSRSTYHCSSLHDHHMPGKSLLDLKRIRLQDLEHPDIVGNPHHPINTLCHDIYQPIGQSIIKIHHYVGNEEQWYYRSDARGRARRQLRYQYYIDMYGSTVNTDVRPWITGFVQAMGKDEARRLLAGVGVLEERPGETQKEDDRIGRSLPSSLNTTPYRVGQVVQVDHAGLRNSRNHKKVRLEKVKPKWCEAEIIHAVSVDVNKSLYNVIWSDDCLVGDMIPVEYLRVNGTDNYEC